MHQPSPAISVVIPAYNEARVIDRLLDGLQELREDARHEVVVVANGCSDDTVRVSQAFPGVQVIELPEGSKAAALNAGDAACTVFPRFFVDADVEVQARDLLRVARVLANGPALAGAPSPHFDDYGAGALVKAFYRHLRVSPYVTNSLVGLGVYGLSEAGRRRFSQFPTDLIADDLFVASHFDAWERRAMEDVHFVVRTPRRLLPLLRVRRRVYLGNAQAEALGVRGSLAGQSLRSSLSALLSAPSRVDALTYFSVNAAAKAWARWSPAHTRWQRDESSRA